MGAELPIFALRAAFDAAIARGPVVISSPTGSGKSTEVPRWCAALPEGGRVVVIEPRRIACRSLAARVAQLEGTRLGDGVGYVVRDERVIDEATRIVFATPGIALRDRALLDGARIVVLDELHERSLEVDLLLALLVRAAPRDDGDGGAGRARGGLVVMSATLDGARVAAHVGGAHLSAEGRAFPVEVRYAHDGEVLPDPVDLPSRVVRALDEVADAPGDVLVFLPGKAEIEACAQALRGRPLTVLPLHGGLGLDEQRRAFEPTPRRKVILATNVAETSLTIPGVGVVVDAGLVRQTRYHEGRGSLALVPIADDSAAQRAGRAGRTGPGVCVRLWRASARLAQSTPPEIHRESLVPLVMAAAAWGARPEELPLLDAPKPYALEAARRDLGAWGALREDGGGLSDGGRGLFALPVDPLQARLLIAARAEGCSDAMIDLVAAMSAGRPLFVASGAPEEGSPEDLRAAGCDATAIIRAVREGRPADHGVSALALHEARLARARLRRMEGLPDVPPAPGAIDRDALLRAALAADPRVAHVARPRGRDVFFGNGGTELELARESAVRRVRDVEAIVVLDTRAFGAARDVRVLVTCAMALPLSALARAGLGGDRLGAVSLEGKRVVCTIERVYAQRVIATREETPRGPLARDAIATLLERGSLWKRAVATSRERLARLRLAAALAARGHPAGVPSDAPIDTLGAWLRFRLETLGVDGGDDLALLSEDDILPPELPYESRELLDRELPATVSVGDATYRCEYDLDRAQVLLEMTKGSRRTPPPASYLPKFPGLRVHIRNTGTG